MDDQEGINPEGEPQASTTQAASGEGVSRANAEQHEVPRGAKTDANPVDVLKRSEKSVKRYQRLAIRVLVIIAVIWVLFFQVIGLTHMPSGDMYPRVDAGDLVLFYRLDTDVRAQDIVVLEKETPDSNGQKQMFISRVVAKGGDVVEVKNDHLLVNGNVMTEDKIFYPTTAFASSVSYPLTLGPDECFVLADRRDEGADSRFFGPVKRSEVKGTVITIVRRNSL